jgi:hypothetical protein
VFSSRFRVSNLNQFGKHIAETAVCTGFAKVELDSPAHRVELVVKPVFVGLGEKRGVGLGGALRQSSRKQQRQADGSNCHEPGHTPKVKSKIAGRHG